MDMINIENTLKKMGLLIEKMAKKVDELDKRVGALEEKVGEKKFSSDSFKTPQVANTSNTSTNSGSMAGSFLGSLAGAMAGMGLFNLLFNHSVTPNEFGKEIGLNEDDLNSVDLSSIEDKLSEIDAKLDEIDAKLEEDAMNSDYFESYEEESFDSDFDSGFSDFDGFDEV